MTQNHISGQNRLKPVCSVKIDENHFVRPKLTKTSYFGQKPVFPVKIDQNHFFRPKPTKTTFFGQNRPKPVISVTTSFSSESQPKPPFPAKIDQNQFLRSKPSFSGQNRRRPIFFGQNRPKPLFLAKFNQNKFFQPKSTKTILPGRKTSKLRPKRDKQTPFSLVLIPSPGRGGVRPRDRVGVE